MDGLTQSYLFKERLLKCEPIDLGRFVVDLRERHLDYWTPYSDISPRECNRPPAEQTLHLPSMVPSKCALPTRRALVTHSPYTLPKYMLLDLPRGVFRSVARFRLCAHTLRIETVTWTHNTSPTCDLCNAHDVQDEQHVLFHCTHPHVVSLRMTHTSLFSSAGSNNVSAFLGQESNKLYFFLHALIGFYEQASSRTS